MNHHVRTLVSNGLVSSSVAGTVGSLTGGAQHSL